MNILKGFIKVLTAGLLSVAIISLLLCVYDVTPVHEENPNGNTDYVWSANSVWIKATEGIAFGKYDANGFNNKNVTDNPDIIILGSSHMEATNVMQNENTAYLLSEKLGEKYSVYNMGISGHNFYKVCQYIPNNLELYDAPPKVLIIETSTVNLSADSVNEVLTSSVEHTPSHSTGLIGALQKVPFFRTLYHQMEGGLLDLFLPSSNKETDSSAEITENDITVDSTAYAELFSYLEEMEETYDTQIVIFYHPTETLTEDGTISFGSDEYVKIFNDYAKEYGISFIDLTEEFENMFYSEHHTAHGFCTGKIATGHLNKYGHAVAAEELHKEIIRLEQDGEIRQ